MNKRKLLAITGVLVMILSGCANTSGVPASAEATTDASSAAAATAATASEATSEASSEATEATNAATSAASDSSDAASKVLDEAIAGKIPVHVKDLEFLAEVRLHHGGTWDSPVGKPRGKASWESLEGKPQIP